MLRSWWRRLQGPDPEALELGYTAERDGRGWRYHDPRLTERRARAMAPERNVDAVRSPV